MAPRLWQTRRVVWSKTLLAFANVDEDSAFDAIPLAEVVSVQQINEPPRDDGAAAPTAVVPSAAAQAASRHPKSADSAQTRFRHALQLKTVPDGFNSGRTYYLQAASDAQCRAVCDSIALHSRRARKAVIAGTRLRRIQGKVLEAYESTPFQSAVAVLILAVRSEARAESARRRDADGAGSACANCFEEGNFFRVGRRA